MKRLLLLLQALFVPILMSAQIAMSVIGEPELVPDDLDARSYYALKDANDMDCAIIKVSLNAPVKGMLVMGTRGGLATVKTEKKADGEWWYWVSPKVTNVYFSSEGYTPTPLIAVALKGKSVYRLQLNIEASVSTVTTFTLQRSVMKLNISPEKATISYGKNEAYDMGSEEVTDGKFDMILTKGTYYYKVESPYYKTVTGKYVLSDNSEEVSVTLPPAYSYLSLDSDPQGAEVFMDGESLGVTPLEKTGKVAKGSDIVLEFRKSLYYIERVKVNVIGNGEVQRVPTVKLRPQFGYVTCLCDDPYAELVITDAGGTEHRGKSGMQVQLPSHKNYIIEAVRPSHMPQQQGIDGSSIEGREVTVKVDAPIPIYGEIQVTSTPSRADVYIDGEKTGTTSLVKMVLIGEHLVELKLEGYCTESFKVNVKKDEPIHVSRNLKERPKVVNVVVSTRYNANLIIEGIWYSNPSTVKMEVGKSYRIESEAKTNSSDYINGVISYIPTSDENQTVVVPSPQKRSPTSGNTRSTSSSSSFPSGTKVINSKEATIHVGDRVGARLSEGTVDTWEIGSYAMEYVVPTSNGTITAVKSGNVALWGYINGTPKMFCLHIIGSGTYVPQDKSPYLVTKKEFSMYVGDQITVKLSDGEVTMWEIENQNRSFLSANGNVLTAQKAGVANAWGYVNSSPKLFIITIKSR